MEEVTSESVWMFGGGMRTRGVGLAAASLRAEVGKTKFWGEAPEPRLSRRSQSHPLSQFKLGLGFMS